MSIDTGTDQSGLMNSIKCLIFDWDETITQHDTMSVFAQASNAHEGQWQGFVDCYMNDLRGYESAYGPRDKLQEHFVYLGGMQDIENRSVRRIEESGIFRGVTRDRIMQVAQQVHFKEGFHDFIARLPAHVDREILSVNWSEEFIHDALERAVKDIDRWKIMANNLIWGDDGRAIGTNSKVEEGGMRTGIDKQRVLQQRLKRYHELGGLVAYIGDSNTDLPALLEADIGIIIGQNASLRTTCEKFNIEILPISQLRDTVRPYQRQNGRLFGAITWHEMSF